MKKLIIVRHAKSSWEHDVDDKERPLLPQGINRAKKHALILKQNLREFPDYWISSDAVRALQTAVIFSSEFGQFQNLNIHPPLYTFLSKELKKEIQSFPDDVDFAIVFGHNDACRLLISELTHENLFEFKTASVAMMEFEQESWEEIEDGKLKYIISKEGIQ